MHQNDTTEAEALAESVMNVTDWERMEAEGLSASETIHGQYGVDPAKHDSERELRAAVLTARKKNGDPDNTATEPDSEPETEPDETERSLGVRVGASDFKEYDDSEADIAALSESMMTVSDWAEADRTDTDPREFVATAYNVDPAEFRDEASLREAIEEADR